jgi:TPP-dependent pyruvate/acetoin dehydrogenase alpha subunit
LGDGVDEAAVSALEAQVEQELQEAQTWALEQPFPTVEQATEHVWIPVT